MTPAPRGSEPADPLQDDRLAQAQQRFEAMPELSFEVHLQLADSIATALPILANGPSIDPRLRKRLLAEAKRLRQLDVARDPAPDPAPEPASDPAPEPASDPAPPVAITLPRFGALLVISCLQMIACIRPTSDSLCALGRVEGRRIQDLVCDTPELVALIDTGWRPPSDSRPL